MKLVSPTQAYDISADLNDRLRSQFVSDLAGFGTQSQQAILGQTPGLQKLNDYFSGYFGNTGGAPADLNSEYSRYLQTAMGTRGGAGGPAGSDLQYLDNAAQSRQAQLLPLYQSVSQGMLAMGGLTGPQNLTSQQQVFQNAAANNMRELQGKSNDFQATLGKVKAGTSALGAVVGLGVAVPSYFQGAQGAQVFDKYTAAWDPNARLQATAINQNYAASIKSAIAGLQGNATSGQAPRYSFDDTAAPSMFQQNGLQAQNSALADIYAKNNAAQSANPTPPDPMRRASGVRASVAGPQASQRARLF